MTKLRTIDIITKLRNEGEAPRLIVQGLLSTKSIMYADIAKMYEEKRAKRKRASVESIIQFIAEEKKVSRATVYRALHVMEVSNVAPKDI